MANVAAPYGALQVNRLDGAAPNYGVTSNPPFRISSAYGTAIGFGDLTQLVAATPTGFLQRWVQGNGSASVQAAGFFYGCKYYSTSQKKTVWSNYWGGSDATGDVEAFVCADPQAIFQIQAGDASNPIDQTYVGCTADFIPGTVNTTTGISGGSLLLPSTSSPTVLPLKVYSIVASPPGVNGTDVTTAYNTVLVTFNNQIFKTLATVDT